MYPPPKKPPITLVALNHQSPSVRRQKQYTSVEGEVRGLRASTSGDPGTLRGRPFCAWCLQKFPGAGRTRGSLTREAGDPHPPGHSRGDWNFLPLGHRAHELPSRTGQP